MARIIITLCISDIGRYYRASGVQLAGRDQIQLGELRKPNDGSRTFVAPGKVCGIGSASTEYLMLTRRYLAVYTLRTGTIIGPSVEKDNKELLRRMQVRMSKGRSIWCIPM